MFIPIPIHYKYKNYPNAPKATAKSKTLGILTSFIAMCLWSFLFCAIVGGVLSGFGINDDTAYIIGTIMIIPFIYVILKWKKKISHKIDDTAIAEAITNASNMSR